MKVIEQKRHKDQRILDEIIKIYSANKLWGGGGNYS
jgi:hypothetical protein